MSYGPQLARRMSSLVLLLYQSPQHPTPAWAPLSVSRAVVANWWSMRSERMVTAALEVDVFFLIITIMCKDSRDSLGLPLFSETQLCFIR